MKNFILFLFFLMAVQSCTVKDGKTISLLKVYNNSQHHVAFIPYQGGQIDSLGIFYLRHEQEKILEDNFQKGKTERPVIFWNYFKPYDSIQLVWDNTYVVTHFLSDTFLSSNKFIQFREDRNIGFSGSYIETSKNATKISIDWESIYTLTESDYNYAKN